MSSLAIYAAPFDNWSNDTNDENIVDKKRTHIIEHKKGILKITIPEKVNSVLQTLHNNQEPSSDDNSMGDYFNPPPKPQSAGVQKPSQPKICRLFQTELNHYQTLTQITILI